MAKILFTAFSRSCSECEVGSLDLSCLEETRGVFVRHNGRDVPVLAIEHEPLLACAQARHLDELFIELEPLPDALAKRVTTAEGPLTVLGLEDHQLSLDLSPRQQRERRVGRDHKPTIWTCDRFLGIDEVASRPSAP